MKKILFFLALFSFFLTLSISLFSQEWQLLNPLPTEKGLYGVCFLDQQNGFVCGEDGVLLRTADGGESWCRIIVPTSMTLRAIRFPSSDTGVAVGNCGTVIRTTDGGHTWQKLPALTPMDLMDVFFLNDTLGWICGTYYRMFRTTDGGATWTTLTSGGPLEALQRIRFLTPDTGFVAGTHGFGDYGILRKTTNGGETWEQMPSPAESRNFRSLEVLSLTDIWVGDYHQCPSPYGPACRLNHTTDGGLTMDTMAWCIQVQTGEIPGHSGIREQTSIFWPWSFLVNIRYGREG